MVLFCMPYVVAVAPIMTNITIYPLAPSVSDDLTVSLRATDIDSEYVGYECQYYINGTINKSTQLFFNITYNNPTSYGDGGIGAWHTTYNLSKVVDNNWTSYGKRATTLAHAYINYTIPYITTQVNLTLRVGAPLTTETKNMSSKCIYNNTFRLLINSSTIRSDFYCYNTTDWLKRVGYAGREEIYEEQISVRYVDSYLNNTDITQSNLSSVYTHLNDNVTVRCRAFDGINYSSWVNNSLIIGVGNLRVYVYDEITENFINDRNVSIDLVSSTEAYNYTTANGSLFIANITYDDWDIRYNAPGYHPREYYVTIQSKTNTIYLYLLNDSTSVSNLVILTVNDQNAEAAQDITVQLQRFYVADNAFKTVSMMRTNFQGQAALYVELYNVWYKFIYKNAEGRVIETTDSTPIFSTTPTNIINTEGDPFESFRLQDTVEHSLNFINNSGVIYARFFYSDITNNVREGCLRVDHITYKEYDNLCYNCTTSTSATLTCVIPANTTGEFKATGLIDTNSSSGWYPIENDFYKPPPPSSLGQVGAFYTAIVVGSMGLMGAATVAGSILLMVLALILMGTASFITGLTLGWYFYLAIIGLMIAFFIRRGYQ